MAKVASIRAVAKRPGRRPPLRREMILAAAAQLFHERGYRGTSIEDIGAAVGMTGPAIYRHFESKEALLTELLERAIRRGQRDIVAALSSGLAPTEALERIVHLSVRNTIEESASVIMGEREAGNLPPETRKRLARERKVMFEAWVEALQAVRRDLAPEEARAIVHGVTSLILAVNRASGLKPDAATELFARMAMAALAARN
jgi:AcrR family transcriptional regulator